MKTISPRTLLDLNLQRVIFALCEDLDTPRSLTVKLLIEHAEWDQLARLSCDPAHYANADLYFRSAVPSDMLRKCIDLPTTWDRDAVAIEAFYEAEKLCSLTNARFSRYLQNGPFEDPLEVRTVELLRGVKSRLARILGPLPEEVDPRHGPGATFNDRGNETTVPHKMSSRPTAHASALCWLPFWEQTSWSRELVANAPYQSMPEIVRGDRFISVAKNAKTNRGIAIGPSVNIFYQLGLGAAMRRKLRNIGVVLEEAQPLHKQVACEASIRGDVATIDLTSASDTVSRKLVEYLFPGDWYEAMKSLRSPLTKVRGKHVYLEKFSSMGNGFTFELETLIFLAIALEACHLSGCPGVPGVTVFVYGDDIIVPRVASRCLLAMLRFCGFKPNREKSFTDGPFRESCGGDYYLGVDVRPLYIEEYPSEPQQWISLANGLRRLAAQYSGSHGVLGPFQRAWFRALDAIPSNIRRLRGPVYLGDVVIHDTRGTWETRAKPEYPYVRQCRAYVPMSKSIPLERWGPGPMLASALYGVPSTGPIPRLGGTEQVQGYRIRWLHLA